MTPLFKIVLLTCLTLLQTSNLHAQSKFVTTRGKQILAPDGSPLLLKGTNLANWLLPEGYMLGFKSANSPRRIETVIDQLIGESEARKFWKTYRDNYITKDDIRFLKKTGFNCVRIPFNYRLLMTEEPQPKFEGVGYEYLDRAIEWCKAEGLYVILDLHAAPGGQTGDNIDDSHGYPFLYESAECQNQTIQLWRHLADRYKDSTTVIGYDLLNEPIAHFFDKEKLNPKLEPLYKRITTAIRQVDSNHLIFIEGAQWASDFKPFGPPFDNKLVYSFHKYWTDPTQAVIQDYVDFGNKHNVPLFMGESGENNDEWIAKFRGVLEQNSIGWTFWPYKKVDSKTGIASIPKPADWDAIVAFAEHPRATFEDIRKQRPAKEVIRRALDSLLERIKFRNCQMNEGYIAALGTK